MADKPKPRGVKSMAFDGLLGHPTLTLTQRRVAWLLVKRANKAAGCYPSLPSIAADLGINRRDVQRALDVLCTEPLSLFRREVRRGRSNANIYFPNWARLVALETASSAALKSKRPAAEKKASIRRAEATEKAGPEPPISEPEKAGILPENGKAKRRELSPEKAGISHVKGGNFDTKAEEFLPVSVGNAEENCPSGDPLISEREEVKENKVANAGAGTADQAQHAAAAPPLCREGGSGLQRLSSTESIAAEVSTADQPPTRPPPPLPPTIAEVEEDAALDAQFIRHLRNDLSHDAIVAIGAAISKQQPILGSAFPAWLRDQVGMSAFAAERFMIYGRLLSDGIVERDMIPPHDERALVEHFGRANSHAA